MNGPIIGKWHPTVKHLARHERTFRKGMTFVNGQWRGQNSLLDQWEQAHNSPLDYARRFGTKVFVETGTYKGETVKAVLVSGIFDQIFTVDSNEKRAIKAKHRFRHIPNVHCAWGDSAEVMGQFLADIDRPALFWLESPAPSGVATSILAEVKAILQWPHAADSVILIRDAHYYDGSLPGWPTAADFKALMPEDWIFEIEDDVIRVHHKG